MTELLFRAVGLALVGSFLSVALKKEAPTMSLAGTLAAAAALILLAVEGVKILRAEAAELVRTSGIEEHLLEALMKISLTAVITKGSADLCRDAGQNAAAYFLEVCGTLCTFLLALPAFKGLIEAISNMFE